MDRLLHHPWYLECSTLFVYVSIENEVQTHDLIEAALKDGKQVCVPRVVPGEGMAAVPIRSVADDLKMGFHNIPEPVQQLKPISEKLVDLVVVPGLLFDREGYRIGYGGGYYDRYLQLLPQNSKTIGVVFHQLLVDRIPHEEYDRRVMLVITEKEMIG